MKFAKKRVWSWIGILLCTITLLTGCTWVIEPQAQTATATAATATVAPPPPAPAPQMSATPPAGAGGLTAAAAAIATETPSTAVRRATSVHLAAAMALVPANSEYFAFTDWTELKRIAGVEVTSADSMDQRMAFMLSVGRDSQAVATIYAMDAFLHHAEEWGWDSTDLLWEASMMHDGPTGFMLRFRDDFDFAPVLDRLIERGYAVSEHARGRIFSHEMDLEAEWIRSSNFAILNIAYFEDENLFVLAANPDTLTEILTELDAGRTLATVPAAQAVAAQLGQVGTAIIAPNGCEFSGVMSNPYMTAETRAMMQARITGLGIHHAFDYFGFGYVVEPVEGRGDDPLPLGLFVHHYGNATDAVADLAGRRNAATTGESLVRFIPYAELFEVIDASVTDSTITADTGANLVLRLHALERPPRLFLDMIYQRDLLFAACGE